MNLEIIDNDLYFNDNIKNKYIKLTPRNWVKIIEDWERLDVNWVRRINKFIRKLKKIPNSPSLYGIKECAQKGDCMFGCISEALNSKLNLDEENLYTIKKIRQIAASQINEDNYDILLNSYKLAYDSNEITWNPNEIDNIEELKELISEPETIWGDHVILSMLSKALKFNIIIFPDEKSNDINSNNCLYLYKTTLEFNRNYPTILLYYIEDTHFQLIGYFDVDNNKILTIFDFNEIPNEIKEIYKNDIQEL